MQKKPAKPFQRTVATQRLDPDFESWLESWTPRSVAERRQLDSSCRG